MALAQFNLARSTRIESATEVGAIFACTAGRVYSEVRLILLRIWLLSSGAIIAATVFRRA